MRLEREEKERIEKERVAEEEKRKRFAEESRRLAQTSNGVVFKGEFRMAHPQRKQFRRTIGNRQRKLTSRSWVDALP